MTQPAEQPKQGNSIVLELLFLSIIALFFELLVIRWMSTNMRAFSTFKTFPLVTCFVGLGVGYAIGRDKIFRYAPLAALFFVVIMKVAECYGVGLWVLPTEGVLSFPNKTYFTPDAWLGYVAIFMLIMVWLLAGPFAVMACIGSRLGVLFNQLKPLNAYIVNIGGSMVGSVVFSVASFAGLSPSHELIPVALVLYWYLRGYGKAGWKALLPLVLTCSFAFWSPPLPYKGTVYWSPYQRIEIQPRYVKDGDSEPIGYWLRVNRAFYQFVYDLSEEAVNKAGLPTELHERLHIYRLHYTLPYRVKKAADVLIIGAGTGNDVAEAIRSGAQSIDACDIDPVILRLGKEINPVHPYESPIVHLICDDARHYMNHCKKKYDLIIFGHLDTQSSIGQGSSMRLDNYVYTTDSFKRTASLLKPDGIAWVSFGSDQPWFQERLFASVEAAVGYPPIAISEPHLPDYGSTVFVFGQPVKDKTVTVPSGVTDISARLALGKPSHLLTDDWPYLYLIPIAIDIPYLLILSEIFLLAIYAGRRVLFGPSNGLDWQLFFLGAAFLLLELQSIARLSLIYGSTWTTSAAVISGVLLMILLANFIVIKKLSLLKSKVSLLYGLLVLSLLVSYVLPVDQVLEATAGMGPSGSLLVTTVTIFPIFLAGIIFAIAFSSVETAGKALGFNLLGAVLGSLFEYLSNYFGINSLVLVSTLLYICSFACFASYSKGTKSDSQAASSSVAG